MQSVAASFLLVMGVAVALWCSTTPSLFAAPAASAAKKGSAKGKAVPSVTSQRKGSAKRTVGRRSSTRRRVPSGPVYIGQQRPTPERLQEIERALVDKGFLAAEPDAVWDQASIEALRRFQQSQNIPADGRLSALSVIALGLGAKQNVISGVAAVAVPVPPPTATTDELPEPATPLPALAAAAPLPPPRLPPPPPAPPAAAAPMPPPPPVAAVAPAPPPSSAPAPPTVMQPQQNRPLVVPDTSIPPEVSPQ